MAALIGSLAAASVMSSFIDKPYKSALCLLTGVGVYASMKGPSFKEDIKSIKERLDMMSEQFKKSLVIAFSTPVVLSSLTWRAICHAFTSFLAGIGLIPLSAYAVISGALSVVGKNLSSLSEEMVDAVSIQRPVMIGQSPDEEDPNKALGSLAALLFTCIGTAFSISGDMPRNMTQWVASICGSVLWSGTKYQALSTFFSALVTMIRGFVDWCIGKVSRASISARISTNRPDIVDAWLQEVDCLTDPSNENDVYNNPHWLKRVLECTSLGELIFRDVMKERPIRFPIPGLIKRYGDIKRLRDRVVAWTTAASVRQEPFCVWLAGNSGIGKSQVSNYVGYNISSALSAEVIGNPIYDIQPGTRFWTGCQGRTIARFDDFNILRGDRNTEDLSNFMRLKSPAIFISEQAEIEDKGKPWAPRGIVVNSNIAYPVSNEVTTHEAFYRRRDSLYLVQYCKKFREKFPELTNKRLTDSDVSAALDTIFPERGQSFVHLEFCRYQDPSNPQSSLDPPIDYDRFIQEVRAQAVEYSSNQEKLYEAALEAIAAITTRTTSDLPLAGYLDEIKNNSAEVICQLSDPIQKKTILGILVHAYLSIFCVQPNIADVMGYAINIKKYFYGESEEAPQAPPEATSSPPTPARKLISRICNPTPICREGIHGPACLCNNPFTLQLLKTCAHCNLAHVRESDSKGWSFRSSSRTFVNGVSELPLICGSNCIFSIHGIRQCLQRENSWLAKEDMTWIDDEQIEEPPKETFGLLEWVKTTTGTILTAIYQCLSSVVFYIISFLIVGGYFAYKTYKNWGKKDRPEPTAFKKIKATSGDIVSSGDPKSSKFQRAAKTGVRFKSFKPQTHVGQAPQDIHHLIQNNIVWIQYMNGDQPLGSPMRAYGLSGYFAVTLKHYWRSPNRALCTHVRVMRSTKGGLVTDVKCPIDTIHFLECEDTEYQVIRLPPQVTTAFKDIRHHFGSVDKFEKAYYPRTATILCQKADISEIINVHINYPITSSPVVGPDGIQSAVVSRPMNYPWGGPGCCMSVVLGFIAGKQYILGFHVAGASDQSVKLGMAEPMFVEHLTELSPEFRDREPIPDELISQSDPSITIDSSVMPVCTLVKQYAQARKTKIIPSALQPLLEVPAATAPAPLTRSQVPDKSFDPMAESLKPHGLPAQPCHPDLYRKANEDYNEMILNHCVPVSGCVRVLTQEEAIEGIPEVGLKSLELSTSEGFPFVLYRESSAEQNKRWLITREVEDGRNVCKNIHTILAETLSRKQHLREQGIVPATVFSDCLKDARIPLYRLNKPGATRVISVSPVDFTIQFRQYFGSFLCAFRYNRMQLEHAIGINVQGLEWTILAGKLHGPGFTKFIDGDHSKFGPRLDPVDSADFAETINEWYRRYDPANPNLERDCAIRKIMIIEANQAMHLVGNFIYQTLCGMPSGFPGTTEWNCASNSKWIRRAWLDCWKHDPSMCNFVAFRNHVRLYTYGDDLTIGVSDTAAVKFNGVFLRDFFHRHDMKFTDAQKGENIDPYKTFDKISFLKHKWTPHPLRPNVYLATIEEQSVHECYRWIHDDGLIASSDDKVLPTLQNCEMALYLAYGHGPTFYAKLRQVFVSWYRQCVEQNRELPEPRFFTWDELDSIIWPEDTDEHNAQALQRLADRYSEYLGDAIILNLEP